VIGLFLMQHNQALSIVIVMSERFLRFKLLFGTLLFLEHFFCSIFYFYWHSALFLLLLGRLSICAFTPLTRYDVTAKSVTYYCLTKPWFSQSVISVGAKGGNHSNENGTLSSLPLAKNVTPARLTP